MARILIVDDEPSIRELIKEVLLMQGHTFATAENGSQALEKLRAEKFDLMISDRNMPVMDGIQAVTLARSNPAYAKMKIIMCTSCSVGKEVDEAFKAGANDYCLKPINLQLLAAKVLKALSTP